MKVLILDDDIQIAEFLKSLIQKFFPKFDKIVIVTNAQETAKTLLNESFELLLFDVELGNNETTFDYIDTFELGNSNIVFVTGHPDYAIEAIKNNAVDYILKPIQIKEFKEAISKVIEAKSKKTALLSLKELQENQEKRISLSDLEQIKFIELKEVDSFEASGAYTVIYMSSGESITSSRHLKHFEELIEDCGFYRVHNSHLVNILKIKKINKKDGVSVHLASGREITISVRKKEEFLSFLEKYITIN